MQHIAKLKKVVVGMRRVFAVRGPFLLLTFFMALSTSGFAASNVIFNISLSGANVTSVGCPSTAYINCYKITMSSIDAFGLTTGSGFRSIISPNTTTPTSAMWIGDANITFQVGNTLNNQNADVSIYAVSGGFSHSYLLPQYCLAGCTSVGSFSTFPAANTVLYGNVSEGPSGGPSNQYPISISTLMNAGNGPTFAGFGTPGVQGDTYQFDIHVKSALGNKNGDALVTIDVQQAATAIMTSMSYPTTFGPMTGLPFTSAQAVTSSPFTGTVNYDAAYSFKPHFSQFASTTGTLKAYVGSNFAPAIAASSVALCDSPSNTTSAVCTPISTNSATPTTISGGITDQSTFSHYMGVVVAEGVGFPGNTTNGSTNASATFTFSIP